MTRYALALLVSLSMGGYILPPPVVTTIQRPVEQVVTAWVSHYSCSEAEGTAQCVEHYTGNRPTIGTAASKGLAYGTIIAVDGKLYEVRDFCPGCEGLDVDLYTETADEANALGAGYKTISIWREE